MNSLHESDVEGRNQCYLTMKIKNMLLNNDMIIFLQLK